MGHGRPAVGRIVAQIDEAARTYLRQKIDERRASCHDCFCYWSCAGDCLIRSFTPERVMTRLAKGVDPWTAMSEHATGVRVLKAAEKTLGGGD